MSTKHYYNYGYIFSTFAFFLILVIAQTGTTFGQNTFKINFPLDISVSGHDLSVDVDTLTPQLGILSEASRTTLSGTISAEFDLLRTSSGLEVLGFRLVGGDVFQSEFTTTYGIETGAISFSTTNLTTNILTRGAAVDNIETVVVDTEGGFTTDLIKLLQSDGTATIGVPKRPESEVQNLRELPILSSLSDDSLGQFQIGSINLIQESVVGQQENYAVTLRLPMRGQQLLFTDVGLPVSVEFLSGELTATGLFTVPEPSTLFLLVASAITCGCVRRNSFCRE